MADEQGFFYVEWIGRACPFCGSAGVSGKSPEGHFFAGCPDPDCLAHNLAYDFVTVDHARAAWNARAEIKEVHTCSNPRCSAAYLQDPSPLVGHCPKCRQPNGVGWSCMTRELCDELLPPVVGQSQ